MRVTHHKQGMICTGTNNSDLNAVLRIPPGKTVEDVNELSGVQVIDSPFAIDFKCIYDVYI